MDPPGNFSWNPWPPLGILAKTSRTLSPGFSTRVHLWYVSDAWCPIYNIYWLWGWGWELKIYPITILPMKILEKNGIFHENWDFLAKKLHLKKNCSDLSGFSKIWSRIFKKISTPPSSNCSLTPRALPH